MVLVFGKIKRALLAALAHDLLGTAKATAYSAILCLFPTILVVTTALALAPESATLRGELRVSFTELLPADTMTLLHSYFSNQKVRSGQVIFSSAMISLIAAMGVMLSLMEGFRKAYDLPRREWPFWMERMVAFALIPSCLAPLAFATVIVAFGHQIEIWVITNTDHDVGAYVLLVWRIVRWVIGILTTVFLLAVIYHFGTPRRQAWKHVIPGRFERSVPLVCLYPAVRVLHHAVFQLLRGLRIAGNPHRHASVALHHLVQRAHGRGIQRPVLSQACKDASRAGASR